VRLKLSAARASASRDLHIRVAWGERPDLGDAFVPENTCVLADRDNAAALFKSVSWCEFLIKPVTASRPVGATFEAPGGVEAEEEVDGEFVRDEERAMTSKVKQKGDVHVVNATIENFSLLYINGVNNFVVKFRRCVDVHGEGEAELRSGQAIPPGVKYITFYLKIPSTLAHHCNLRGISCSKNAHGLDINERGISVGDFFCAIKSAPKLVATTLVSQFGLQPWSGTGRVFAFKNAAVKTGESPTSCTHEEVEIVVDPEVFEANAMCPFSRHLQPSYLIVNDAAIRFKIGNMLVNTLLPYLMLNNTMPAMISVAMVTLLGHNYTEIVSGNGSVVKLFPCAWLYSSLANTGKTTALNLGQSCMGTKLIMTSGSTIPHARVRAGQSGGLGVVVLDDYSPEKMAEFAVFIRAVAGDGDEGRVNTAGTYVANRQTGYAFSVTILFNNNTHTYTPCISIVISFIHTPTIVVYRPTTSPPTRRHARASSYSNSRRSNRRSMHRHGRRRTLRAFSACSPPTSSTSSSTHRA